MSNPDRPTTRCGACGGVVYADAAACKHCGAPPERMLAPRPDAPAGPRCPHCEGRVARGAQRCKHCGRDLP